VVEVKVPNTSGDYGFIYTIQNPRGGTDQNFLTVQARTDAPLSRPVARDTVLTLSDVLDRQTVDVDVLANVFFGDGSARELDLSLLSGYDGTATVTASQRIRVRVGDASQIIPFAVAHPDDPTIIAYAFVRVPGYDDALPQLRRTAPKITVVSESVLTIDINDYVVAVGGKKVRLTDSGTVRATHADGSDLAVDSDTIRYRSVDKYFGPASISFEVTDGDSASDPAGRVATIVLPLTVTPRENQPPAFTGAVIDFEPGQSKTIQLGRLTTYPYPDDMDELEYTVLQPLPADFTYSLDGQRITLKAGSDASKGTQDAITIGVRDDLSAGSSGRIVLRVVPSTRPIAVPAADAQIAPRGQTTIVDVLANDAATNPFPETPLRVVAVRGIDSGTLPAGVTIVPSADRSSLRVSVSNSAAPVDTNLQYQVADATGDPDRFAWGSVRISVQDRPDPVTGLRVTGYGDRSLSVAFDAAAFNNSPITGYAVSLLNAGTGAVVATTACAATTCTVPTPGNGEANSVRVQVVATNGIGSSDPAATPTAVWSDVIPSAPTGVSAAPLDGALAVSWDEVVVSSGTPVSSYVINVGGIDTVASADCPGGRCSATIGSLANGSLVSFTVSARNGAYPALTAWTSTAATGTPFGPPTAGQIGVASLDPDNGAITVSWSGFGDGGDPIAYFVARLSATAPVPACTVSSPAPGTVTPPSGGIIQDRVDTTGTSAQFTGLVDDNATYTFIVWAYNRAGCVASAPVSTVLRPAPGPVSSVSMDMVDAAYSRDAIVTGFAPGFDHYRVRSGPGGQEQAIGVGSSPRTLTGAGYGRVVGFQVQGCTSWNSCGPWGNFTTPAAPIDFDMGLGSNLQYTVVPGSGDGVWSWVRTPDNSGLPASFACGVSNGPDSGTVTATSCTIPGVGGGVAVFLRITIDGLTRTYNQ
jgi:hypothetical protein